MRLANCMSLGMIVTLLAWIAHRFVSSNKPTMYDSAASYRASTAWDWNLRSALTSCAISLTRRWNGSLRIKSSVDFWNFRISRRATVPGRNLCGFFRPPAWLTAAVFRAALFASYLRGAFAPVFLRAVYFVLAIGYFLVFIFCIVFKSSPIKW